MAALFLAASCDTTAPDEPARDRDGTIDELGRETLALHTELMTRLRERGVTLADIDAAVQDSDGAAMRDLFTYLRRGRAACEWAFCRIGRSQAQ